MQGISIQGCGGTIQCVCVGICWAGWACVMSHNTLVTLLTNFRPVPGHAVTSLCILRFPELRFCAQTWMQKPPTLLALTSLSRQAISRSSRSRKIPTPDPISYYSLSLASCFCPTLHSCVSHSCNIAFLCFLARTSDTPDLMLCPLF